MRIPLYHFQVDQYGSLDSLAPTLADSSRDTSTPDEIIGAFLRDFKLMNFCLKTSPYMNVI